MRDPQDYAGIWTFLRKAVWKHKFALLPHRCRISKKWIWLKKGYEGTATYTGPGTPVTETHWHTTGEHIKWLLTKDDSEKVLGYFYAPYIPVFQLIAQDILSVQPMTDIFKKKE